jgi:hypothetical protein
MVPLARARTIALLTALFVVAAPGCTRPSAGENPTASAAPSSGDVQTKCSDVPPATDVVQESWVAEDTPVGKGGVLTPGTWVMTTRELYTGKGGKAGPSGASEAQVAHVTVSGNTATAQIARTGMPTTKTLKLTFTPGSPVFAVRQTCPTGHEDHEEMGQFTATPTTFVVIGDGPETHRVRTFVKR